MEFEFEDKTYRVSDMATIPKKLIKLPDGRVLIVKEWKKCHPPQPKKMELVMLLSAKEIK